MWSDNILNRAVCGEESMVILLKVSPNACCGAIEKEEELGMAASKTEVYSQEGEPFSVPKAKPLQVRMALAAEIVDVNGCAFLAVCFVRTLVFAGRRLEEREQDERQSSRQ